MSQPNCADAATAIGWSGPATATPRAAALEAVVDLHTLDPSQLERTVLRAGGIDVRTVTDELTAAWWGWPVAPSSARCHGHRTTVDAPVGAARAAAQLRLHVARRPHRCRWVATSVLARQA